MFPTLTTPPAMAATVLLNEDFSKATSVVGAHADITAKFIANVWAPPQGISPADMLEALGTSAGTQFKRHAASVAYLWADTDYRGSFLEACNLHGVTVQTGADGLPVFPQIPAYTVHSDGSISIN